MAVNAKGGIGPRLRYAWSLLVPRLSQVNECIIGFISTLLPCSGFILDISIQRSRRGRLMSDCLVEIPHPSLDEREETKAWGAKKKRGPAFFFFFLFLEHGVFCMELPTGDIGEPYVNILWQ